MVDSTDIKWAPLLNQNYWTTKIKDIKQGGTSFFNKKTNQAIVDSGTTVLVMEGADYTKFEATFDATWTRQ